MKVLADQNVSRRVVEELRRSGVDVLRVGDVLHPRATDIEVLAESARLGAVVLSHDQDFSALLTASGATRPSLVNLRVSDVDAARIARVVATVLVSTEQDLEAGAIVTIDDMRVRIRRLPIG